MLYGEAAPIAREYGLSLRIRPDDYECSPPGADCPYPGEPADQPGWLIVVEGVEDYFIANGLPRLVAWVGEGSGIVYTFAD